jgi:glucose-1-phosphate thymidylyltransferase
VILGDNIIEGSVRQAADSFRRQSKGAHILLKQVHDAERFGVAEVADGRVVGIEEKPQQPKSDFAVTGIYMYDATEFDKIRTLVPSGRGELEITDVNNAFIREGTMSFSVLEGWWTDAGTFDSLLRAGSLVAQSVNHKRTEASPAARRWKEWYGSDGGRNCLARGPAAAVAKRHGTRHSRMPERDRFTDRQIRRN